MKLCDTCIYRNNVEQLKPCIIYRDNCKYYEKERGDMTREEALYKVKGYLTDIIPAEDYSEVEEIIKALEQEPCGDAISRQIISDYVQSHIQEINTGYGDLNKHTNEILRMIVDYIETMSSVNTQEPKTVIEDIKTEISKLQTYKLSADTEKLVALDEVLQIIDKYNAESEV